MKIALKLFLLCALVAAGWWLWTIFFPTPERVICGRLASLAKTVSFTGKENVLVRANNIGSLQTFFAPEIEITVNLRGLDGKPAEAHQLMGHDEIALAAQAAHASGGPLQIEFLDPVVSLAVDGQSATVNLTLRAKIPRDKNFIVQEMKFTMKKAGKEWLIIRIETVRTLS